MISYQPKPKIPPIGFFQPISIEAKDMMTDVEFLLGILKKLNETIKNVNSNTDFINSYTGKIEELESELESIRVEIQIFEDQVNETIIKKFNDILLQFNSMIATTITQCNAYTDIKFEALNNEIEQIVIGQITIYDPTTGLNSPLQDVINNIYNSSRTNALTASEYDSLNLTANTYDGYQITAFNYDQNGKTILMV